MGIRKRVILPALFILILNFFSLPKISAKEPDTVKMYCQPYLALGPIFMAFEE